MPHPRERASHCAAILPVFIFLLLANAAPLGAEPASHHSGDRWLLRRLGLPDSGEPVDGFKSFGGTWTIDGDELRAGAGPGPKLVCEEPAFDVGEVGVEVRLRGKGDGNAGLIVKVSEPGVGADRFLGYEISLDSGLQAVRLGRHRHDFQLIRDVPCQIAVDEWIPLAVRVEGSVLEIRVAGRTVLRHDDGAEALPAGRVGLRPWQREAAYRNLWIETNGRRTDVAFRVNEAQRRAQEALRQAELPPIACIVRHPLGRPNAVACDLWQSQPTRPGCAIRVFDPSRSGDAGRTIFSDSEGCIYDMNASCDAETLLFSYRPQGEKYWHIYRIGVDGSGLAQLTDGPCYDVSPVPLPGGDVVFVSTRRGGYTVCQPGPASNLHRMAADGSNVRCVSMNTLSDFTPQRMPDGRILFTRWEYVDRDLTYRQSLWTQNPDGRGYQLFFGNTIRDVGTFWQARPLPGRRDVLVATFAPHHGWPQGAIGLITNRFGPEAPRGKGFVWITKEFPLIGDRPFEWAYRDPYPLSESLFLCSFGSAATRKWAVYLLDVHGNKRLLYEDADFGCYNPLPLQPAPAPPAVAGGAEPRPVSYGTLLLADVYRGLNGIPRGRAQSLRVMEQVRKSEDLVSRAYDQSPVMGYGTYYAKRCWGTVPIEEDGSACFRAPALREIYFQVLDAEGRELQRMTSAAQLMPGQTLGCIGCHEPRNEAPPRGQPPRAARRPARELERPDWLRDGIVDFPSVVQPVLDKHCVSCHGGPDPDDGLSLTGDKTRLFNVAYDSLLGRSRSYRQHDMATGGMLPEERQKGKPLVHFYWLLRAPTAVNQPLWTGSHASRLLEYVDSDHCEKRIPLADRQRIYLWIDANVPYYGTYAHSRPRSPGRRDLCTDVDTGKPSRWFVEGFLEVYGRRCRSCHGAYPNPNDKEAIWDGRLAWINFTNPRLSPALTAHLAKPAGGQDIPALEDGKSEPLFPDTADPDYAKLLAAIEVGARSLVAHPRADVPGFPGAIAEE